MLGWSPRYTEFKGREQRIWLAKLLLCLAAKPQGAPVICSIAQT